MVSAQTIEEFLSSARAPLNPYNVVMSLLLSALFGYVLALLFQKYGTSLSNRKKFSQNFILISTTTTLIITIVKSSLALSLGLVGALSIIRFRTAIKEPEELTFVFLCISIGLGFGADQYLITIISFLIISALILLRSNSAQKENNQNMSLTIIGNKETFTLAKITKELKKYCGSVHLKRFDQEKDELDATFFVTFKNFKMLETARSELLKLGAEKVIYLDRE